VTHQRPRRHRLPALVVRPAAVWSVTMWRERRGPPAMQGGADVRQLYRTRQAPGRKPARDRNHARNVFAEGVPDNPVAAAEGDDRLQAGANVSFPASRRMPAAVCRRFWAVARSPVGRMLKRIGIPRTNLPKLARSASGGRAGCPTSARLLSYLCREVGHKSPRLSAVLSYPSNLHDHFRGNSYRSGSVQRVKAAMQAAER
jgi:hypothetical protein